MGGHSWNPFKRKSNKGEASTASENIASSTAINAVYYPNWRVYRSQPPSSLNLRFITHIFYAFARVETDGAIVSTDEWADSGIDINGIKGCINDLKAVKERYPHVKTVLSFGGGGKGSEGFPAVAGNANSRLKFAHDARRMIDSQAFDGIDIDWEHPSNSTQGAHYIQLLSALRQLLPTPQYLLTSALPAGQWALRNINIGRAANYLDLINLMTYDFSGPWTDVCGHQSQLYSPTNPPNDAASTSCDSAVKYVLSHGVKSQKILMGIPAYGRSFLEGTGVGTPYNGSGGEMGSFEYKDLPRPRASVHIDNKVVAVYCVGRDGGFVTYDDTRTVRVKAEYAKKQGLGGLFYWTGTGDRNDYLSLVEAGYRCLYPHQP
ncbi:hypothetical protein ACLMJK_006797 [Lecanora helva]